MENNNWGQAASIRAVEEHPLDSIFETLGAGNRIRIADQERLHPIAAAGLGHRMAVNGQISSRTQLLALSVLFEVCPSIPLHTPASPPPRPSLDLQPTLLHSFTPGHGGLHRKKPALTPTLYDAHAYMLTLVPTTFRNTY